MPRRAKDPLAVAVLLFSLLLVTLLLYLLGAVVREKTPKREPEPFIPPGWVNPTSPPPSRIPREMAP